MANWYGSFEKERNKAKDQLKKELMDGHFEFFNHIDKKYKTDIFDAMLC